jgi:hypothetical protein
MIIEREEDIIRLDSEQGADSTNAKDNDEDIKHLTRRKDVLNNVLEKLIDKINQPQKPDDEQ